MSLQYLFIQLDLNMRQWQWMDLVTDYDLEITYNPRKVSLVADAPRRRRTAVLAEKEI